MANPSKIKGVEAAIKALRRYRNLKGKNMERGVKKAGLYLQRLAQQMTPVDTGALKNSANTRITGKGVNCQAIVGFYTSYAIFVHENLDSHHVVGQAKFLTTPLHTHRQQILNIIMEELRKS